ncbi:hypothetical protein ABLO26_18585 [Neobacillus sp. 179-J 1A1 HS]|uniref:hypothetical protein n=1 Tax=Neobacillus driksii TaxID=3035913 RepID=UPI0035BC83A5
MKKIVTLLCTSLIVLLMFVAPGNVAFAEDECGCITEEITGAEKNKIVADLLKNVEFKYKKQELMNDGYRWNGVNEIEVIRNITYGGLIMVGVPFIAEDGTVMMAAFFEGSYMGIAPRDEDHSH